MLPAGPFMAPSNGNFSLPPAGLSGPPREPLPKPPSSSTATASRDGSLSDVNIVQGTGGPGQEKWIHRLRELERRLKAEREARLLDRSGMRKRLEERDAVNEELREELRRERVRRSMDLEGRDGGGGGFEPYTVEDGKRYAEEGGEEGMEVGMGQERGSEDVLGDDEATPVRGRR
jgi:hypothetical protein